MPWPALAHMCWPGTWAECISIVEPQCGLTTRSVASFFLPVILKNTEKTSKSLPSKAIKTLQGQLKILNLLISVIKYDASIDPSTQMKHLDRRKLLFH